MPVGKVLGAAVLALVAGIVVEGSRAKAAEVFVCDGGRLVRAKPADLDRLKRTDPCIARYFGLTIADPAAADDERAPEPVTRASGAKSHGTVEPGPAEQVTPILDGGSDDPELTVGRVIEPEAAPIAPPKPRLPSDHRNVLLLNPEPGASPYFRLRR